MRTIASFLLVAVAVACGPKPAPKPVDPTVDPVTEPPPTLATVSGVEGIWDEQRADDPICFAFCPDGKALAFFGACGVASNTTFIAEFSWSIANDQFVLVVDGEQNPTSYEVSADTLTFTDPDGTKMDLRRSTLAVDTVCAASWQVERAGDQDDDGVPDEYDMCPGDSEDWDDFEDEDGCPEPDNDRDGVLDVDDMCPNDPEDHDGNADEDGCPDGNSADRDGDGVGDNADACPDDPEDYDGFMDNDGCPDMDNDSDGILDVDDLCPNDREDRDGFEDADGCPDPDNDGDGIPDMNDRCPNDPETVNGRTDTDGCPD